MMFRIVTRPWIRTREELADQFVGITTQECQLLLQLPVKAIRDQLSYRPR